jgi:hypothetical protein
MGTAQAVSTDKSTCSSAVAMITLRRIRAGLTLSGTWTRWRRRRETVELLAELPLAQLCTHVLAFRHAAEAFGAVDEGIPGLMHAVLDDDRSATGDM